MPRIRTIKPSFLHDEALDDLGDTVRLVYVGLWMYADREGRLEDRPRYLSTQILPYRPHLFEPALTALIDGGWVQRYAVNGHDYLHLPKFLLHQRPHHTEAASVLPAPDLDTHQRPTVTSPLVHGILAQGKERILDQGKDQGKEKGKECGVASVSDVWDAWTAAFTTYVGQPLALTPKGSDVMHLQRLAQAHIPRDELADVLRLFLTAPGYVTKRSLGMFAHALPELRAWRTAHGLTVPFGDARTIKAAQRHHAGAAAEVAFLAARDDA